MSGAYSTNSIEQLLGSPTGGPETPVSQNEIRRVQVSANIVRQNFDNLDDFVDGDIENDGLIVVYNPAEQEAASLFYRHIHNYLSSLYSFNEQVRVKVNENASPHSISKSDQISTATTYSQKLAFIRGLRIDFQHAEFDSLTFEREHQPGSFSIYSVKFDETKFRNSVDFPDEYLRHSQSEDRDYPICYIADFHFNYFNDFVDDTMDWLKGTP